MFLSAWLNACGSGANEMDGQRRKTPYILIGSIGLCVSDYRFSNAQEREQPREGQATDLGSRCQPQNDRERAFWNMIQQLRSEVSQLRQQIGNRDRRGAASDKPVRNSTVRPSIKSEVRASCCKIFSHLIWMSGLAWIQVVLNPAELMN